MLQGFKSLGKTARRAVVIGVMLATIAGVAVAAWSLTRETTGTGMVLGTFMLTDLGDCGSIVVGETSMCVTTLSNHYDHPVTVTAVRLEPNRDPDNEVNTNAAAWEIVSGVNPVPVGGTIEIGQRWYPMPGCPTGEVLFTMYVTAAAD